MDKNPILKVRGPNDNIRCGASAVSGIFPKMIFPYILGDIDYVTVKMKCGKCGRTSWVEVKPNKENKQSSQCLACGAVNVMDSPTIDFLYPENL